MPPSHFEVQSFDSHPLTLAASSPNSRVEGCSIMVNVSGVVRFEDKGRRGFSETFVLKPQPDQPKVYKILAHSFRFVTAYIG
jgi:hypothetical protein